VRPWVQSQELKKKKKVQVWWCIHISQHWEDRRILSLRSALATQRAKADPVSKTQTNRKGKR
jgi:hypothetical protein